MSTENEQVVLTERRGHILVVTLNRPEVHNACNLALARGISDAMDLLDGERTVFQSLEDAFPQAGQGSLRALAGCFGFSGDDVEKPCRVLSGGEKTRLALATLVVSSANVLLLDEPTNNLDPASRAQVLDAIGNFGGAIVLVTHDEGAVHALDPDRVLVLPDGTEDMWSADYAELISLA